MARDPPHLGQWYHFIPIVSPPLPFVQTTKTPIIPISCCLPYRHWPILSSSVHHWFIHFFLPPIATAINPPFPLSSPFLSACLPLSLVFCFVLKNRFDCSAMSIRLLYSFLSVSLANEWIVWWGLTAALPSPNVHGTWGRVGTSACLWSDFCCVIVYDAFTLFFFPSVGGICEGPSYFLFRRPLFYLSLNGGAVVVFDAVIVVIVVGHVVLCCWHHSPKPTIHYFIYVVFCCTQKRSYHFPWMNYKYRGTYSTI